MFEVLAFVYENYYTGEPCPEPEQLQRKLNAVGFEAEEIDDALTWLKGLQSAVGGALAPHEAARNALPGWLHEPRADSVRIYSLAEQNHLGARCLGFISFLEAVGELPAPLREVVMERAMATPGRPLRLNHLKTIILMVYWNFGSEPSALVLDELYEDDSSRVLH